jgi:hypothetical protein
MNGQSRDTGNIGYTRHGTKTKAKTKSTTQHRKLKKTRNTVPTKSLYKIYTDIHTLYRSLDVSV